MILMRLMNLGCAAISLILLIPSLLGALALFAVLGFAGLLPGPLADAHRAGVEQVSRWVLTSGTYDGARITAVEVRPLPAAADGSPRVELALTVRLDGRGDLEAVARTVLRSTGEVLAGPLPLASGVGAVRLALRDDVARLAVRVERRLLDEWRAGRRTDAELEARW